MIDRYYDKWNHGPRAPLGRGGGGGGGAAAVAVQCRRRRSAARPLASGDSQDLAHVAPAVPSTRGHVEVGESPVGRRQTADGGRGKLALLELSPETPSFTRPSSLKALPRRGGTEKEQDAPVSPLGLPPPPLRVVMLCGLQLPACRTPPRRGPVPRAAAGQDGNSSPAIAELGARAGRTGSCSPPVDPSYAPRRACWEL